MERLLKWLDEFDDLAAMFRVSAPAVVVTTLLVIAFVVAVGAMFVLGPPDLHAAP